MYTEIFKINYGKPSQADEIYILMCTARLMVLVSTIRCWTFLESVYFISPIRLPHVQRTNCTVWNGVMIVAYIR